MCEKIEKALTHGDDKLYAALCVMHFRYKLRKYDELQFDLNRLGRIEANEEHETGKKIPFAIRMIHMLAAPHMPQSSSHMTPALIFAQRFLQLFDFCLKKIGGRDKFENVKFVPETLQHEIALDISITSDRWISRLYLLCIVFIECSIDHIESKDMTFIYKYMPKIEETFEDDPLILSLKAKLYLRNGDLVSARSLIEKVECMIPNSDESTIVKTNRFLLDFCEENIADAKKALENMTEPGGDNEMLENNLAILKW
eukprot:TRINITY_DN12748_c0_g1_i5.p2 TRINITY_DN12748_c0_g1~~TRINITY_DN12748_c0_g1_i5.p2  ORF type:complete len:256 (+),score=44.75 TRINITY_DN12748_c0_g1_i5:366-1133(+)